MAQKIKDLAYYMSLAYTIRLQEQKDGDWYADIPELPGCIAAGDSKAEALDILEEAKESWLMVSLEDGDVIPEPKLILVSA
ncbi:MAG: type II toxin-antitoxin system HicB family antitoxin [Phototrophicaceae bacterium]